MPNYLAKVSSAYLSNDAIRGFMASLPSIMLDIYGNQNLKVYYGWACKLHADLLYKSMGVPLDAFPHFIEDSIEQRIFVLGGSDLLVESPGSNLQILICHESDIHLDGIDEKAIHRIMARFPEFDFRTADQWKVASDIIS